MRAVRFGSDFTCKWSNFVFKYILRKLLLNMHLLTFELELAAIYIWLIFKNTWMKSNNSYFVKLSRFKYLVSDMLTPQNFFSLKHKNVSKNIRAFLSHWFHPNCNYYCWNRFLLEKWPQKYYFATFQQNMIFLWRIWRSA